MRTALLFILIGTFSKSFACGGGWEEPYYYSFFEDYSDTTAIHPYVYQPHYKYYGYQNDDDIEPNLEAWNKHFKGKYPVKDIRDVLYNSSLKSAIKLNQLRNGTKPSKEGLVKLGKLEKALVKGKENDFLNYLIYAKKCEESAQAVSDHYYSWHSENEVGVDTLETAKLIQEGTALYGSTKSLEMRTRYGFQLVRLAHYQKSYDLGYKLFHKYVEPLKSEKYIYYRAWEQFAGVLHSLGKTDLAGYIFSRVFDKCPDRRQICVSSFNFGESEFYGVLELCKDKQEKSILYAMRALTNTGSPEGEMNNIIEIDPCSPYVEWFFTSTIYHAESNYFTKKEYWSERGKESPFNREYGLNNLNNLRDVAIKMQTECSEERKEFWRFNEAYVHFMQQNYNKAREVLATLNSTKFDKQRKELNGACDLLSIDVLTPELEIEWHIKANEFDDKMKDLYYNVIKVKFFENKEYAKAYLVNNDYSILRGKLDINMIELLLTFKPQQPKNRLEESLQKKVSLQQLYTAKGNYYLLRNELKEALKAYKKSDNEAEMDESFGSSMVFRTSESHTFDTYFEDQSSPLEASELNLEYSFEPHKVNFVNKLIQLDSIAWAISKTNPNEAAKIFLNLGSAWNNMSPYGWFRPIQYSGDYRDNCCDDYTYNVVLAQPPRNPKEQVWDFRQYMRSYKRHYDPSIASRYLLKALSSTKNRELKAKTIFKLSETALYKAYAGPRGYYYNLSKNSAERKNWYSELKKLDDTEYYQEVLNECGYFAHYVKTN